MCSSPCSPLALYLSSPNISSYFVLKLRDRVAVRVRSLRVRVGHKTVNEYACSHIVLASCVRVRVRGAEGIAQVAEVRHVHLRSA